MTVASGSVLGAPLYTWATWAMQAPLAQRNRPGNQACNTIQGLGLGVWGLRAPQRSSFQGDLGVGLRPLQEHVGTSA